MVEAQPWRGHPTLGLIGPIRQGQERSSEGPEIPANGKPPPRGAFCSNHFSTRARRSGTIGPSRMPSPSQFLSDLVALLKSLCKALRGESKEPPCAACPPALKKPDPFLYSQQYLMSLGLPVTWDNPDIYIYEGSTLVDTHDLKASTDYTVIARVWNNSPDVPVMGLGVGFFLPVIRRWYPVTPDRRRSDGPRRPRAFQAAPRSHR